MKTENWKLKIENWERGVSLYLAIVIMSVILALALAISSISLSQIKMAGNMGDSVVAFYAAETGAERELFEKNIPPFSYSGSVGDAVYEVQVIVAGQDDCPSDVNYCVKSTGSYENTKRAIQIAR